MHREDDEIHVDDIEASAGSKEGVVRWVLGIGLVLAIATLSFIWITGAVLSAPEETAPRGFQGAAAETG